MSCDCICHWYGKKFCDICKYKHIFQNNSIENKLESCSDDVLQAWNNVGKDKEEVKKHLESMLKKLDTICDKIVKDLKPKET